MNPETPAPSAVDAAIEAEHFAWPVARIDPVARLRALAAGLPHVAIDETVFEAPFERVWSFLSDLEHSTPRYEAAVTALRLRRRAGERFELEARLPIGVWLRYEGVLRPGFCLMRSRLSDIGMAARPEGGARTRFVHFEGARTLGRLGRPLFARNIRRDFRRLRALLEAQPG